MPTCGSCGKTYYNFSGPHKCGGAVPNTQGWGVPFGNAARPSRHIVSSDLPFRFRTGTLTEPEPPEAA